MGTRNITRVIMDKNTVVEQYCQWDGYPTGQGKDVMMFVKEYCGKNLPEFKNRLEKSYLYMALHGNTFYTGAPVVDGILEKLRRVIGNYVTDYKKKMNNLILSNVITVEEATYYISASRDTGPSVLFWLMEHCPSGMTFYTEKYLHDITDELDWQIEGMFTIDLDKETVEINYHGNRFLYPFDKVVGMSEEEIGKEMERIEKGEEESE